MRRRVRRTPSASSRRKRPAASPRRSARRRIKRSARRTSAVPRSRLGFSKVLHVVLQ